MSDITRLTAALASGEDCWGPLADAYEDAGWEWHAERARRAAAPAPLLLQVFYQIRWSWGWFDADGNYHDYHELRRDNSADALPR